jgi:ArsR family transcriptional regulator
LETKFEILRLISDSARFHILTTLLDYSELNVSELEQLLGMKQSNTSKHLKKMKDAGILESRRDKNIVYYRISNNFMIFHEKLIQYLIL